MYIKLYNDSAFAVICGAMRKDTVFALREIDGIGIANKNFTVISLYNEAGRQTINTRDEERYVTLSVDARCGEDFQSDFETLTAVLDGEFTMEIHTDISRKITARCENFAIGARHGIFRELTMQFVCDFPYFTDLFPTVKSVHSRENLVNLKTKPPAVLTKRTSNADIGYEGGVKTAPTFEVDIISDGCESIVIKNETHNEKIQLDYAAEKGEKITLNLAEGTVFSSDGADLAEYLSNDTFLEDFYLHPGENRINVTCGGDSLACAVSCSYLNRYREGAWV